MFSTLKGQDYSCGSYEIFFGVSTACRTLAAQQLFDPKSPRRTGGRDGQSSVSILLAIGEIGYYLGLKAPARSEARATLRQLIRFDEGNAD